MCDILKNAETGPPAASYAMAHPGRRFGVLDCFLIAGMMLCLIGLGTLYFEGLSAAQLGKWHFVSIGTVVDLLGLVIQPAPGSGGLDQHLALASVLQVVRNFPFSISMLVTGFVIAKVADHRIGSNLRRLYAGTEWGCH
jgi:hypothetical protein